MRVRRIYNLYKTMKETDPDYFTVMYMWSCASSQIPMAYSYIPKFKEIEKRYKLPFDRKLFLEELYDKTIGFVIFRVSLWWMFHNPRRKKYDLSGTSHWDRA